MLFDYREHKKPQYSRVPGHVHSAGAYLVSVGENNAVEFGRFEVQVFIDISAYRVVQINSPWLGRTSSLVWLPDLQV